MKKALFMLCAVILLFSQTLITKAEEQPSVGILLFDGVQIIDFTGPWEVFGHAKYSVKTVSSDGQQITTTMGMKVTPDYSYRDAPQFDILLVPGGHVHNVQSARHIKWIGQHAKQTDFTLSVCTGALLLADAGLLKNKEATTFFSALDMLEDNYDGIIVRSDVRYTHSDNIVTSAGLSSGIDASLYVVSQQSGLQKAREIAMHMEYDWDPDTGFIRGLMADKYLPDLHIDFADDTKFNAERVHHYGNEDQWQQHHKIDTDAKIETVLSQIQEQVGKQGWQYQKQTDVWHKVANETPLEYQYFVTDIDPHHKTFTFQQKINVL
ncbi:DJ-1/PfpI family protein [Alteromonas ponticola]|uniref:DJ-1/PfpI family protein n=1 Tax=Alteromonas aquimaris TaxID=2998417 RepID=A0ABT3P8X0_9ALTE|nr:DJ-1/PfpI family protein [Alteromonas aquimaris]MCW8109228.1 DJ-1/PfpI family protein [Alteromonas aquimaris]